ncbi:hypothetical protein VTK73DRAFT_3226 [Phialemonium thermophilum]|uniref:Sec20 C-terminal domain-containing protein n=1 Tax=Phialemonium thermophilum TaxID=223376 RepID=A0ABR3Y8R8_9PEZI
MSFETLQERLSVLQETTSQLKELIDRLANLKFEPGSVPLGTSSVGGDDGESDGVAGELSVEINQTLREEEDDLEALREEITDLRVGRTGSGTEHDKARLKDGVSKLERELKSCRVAFRKAQLSARRSLEKAQRLERELLLASFAASAATTPAVNRSQASSPRPDQGNREDEHMPPSPTSPTIQQLAAPAHEQLFPASYRRRRHQRHERGTSAGDGDGTNENVVAASTDVTAALRRTHELIAGELARSAFARQTLEESTAALGQLRQGYAGLEGALASSRRLVGGLLTAQKSDTWYLETAFLILVSTLVWLIFRRWLYGPLWWLLWLPVRTAWRLVVGGAATGAAVVKKGTGEGAKSVVVGGRGEDSGPLGDADVPTVRVGGSVGNKQTHSDPDSMVHTVGKIVEGDASHLVSDSTNDGDVEEFQPNPMKRMWEEDVGEAQGAGSTKDEL